MDFSGSGISADTDNNLEHQAPSLPGYVPYLSLLFKLTATTFILLLSGWVVYTIKVTKDLHKPHNMFVANLLVSGMIDIIIGCLMAGTMMICFQLGVEPFISCNAFKFRLFPTLVSVYTILVLAADKMLVMVYLRTFPFKYPKVMTLRRTAYVIGCVWVIAAIPTAYTILFSTSGFTQVAEYGTCKPDDTGFAEALVIFIIPATIVPFLSIVVYVCFAVRAHRICKELEREKTSREHGESSESSRRAALKRGRSNIRKSLKQITALLVVALGNMLITLFINLVFISIRFLADSQGYQDFNEYVVASNASYAVRLLHPFVYGLLFKKTREPMLTCLNRYCKIKRVNVVAPHP